MSEKRIGENPKVVSVKVKGKEARVVLDNGEKIVLSVDSFTEFHLYEGKELDPGERTKIAVYASQDQAYDAALRLLGHESYSCAEMQRRLLSKGFEPRVVSSVIERLVSIGLLDDARYVKTYAEDVAELRLIGHNRVLYDLRAKGIGEDLLKDLAFPREKELAKAKDLAMALDRRYYRAPYAKRVLKINRALLERGYDESVAFEASKACAKADDPEVERAEIEKALQLATLKYSKKYQGYELSRRVYAFLVRKGFAYDAIKSIMEENDL